jgi:site-specific DNA-methyltransferase (cytosine-N4-specific)
MRESIADNSIDLIVTSPPFALLRKKDYGNEEQDAYVSWFKSFGFEFFRILKPTGSLVIDIGGSWVPGQPTRSLYHFELLIMLCREIGFHLAQEFYWWNPSKLPTPAEWVNVRRVRVKDAVNSIYWLSKTPWPKASNRRILIPYSESMEGLLKNGYNAKLRPSGHDISEKFNVNNGAAIPPNLLAIPNTESNSAYIRYCHENDLPVHPARFPGTLPEFFIRMLTDTGDIVYDPFGGSCIVGAVCERLKRHWICSELDHSYVQGAMGRFQDGSKNETDTTQDLAYKIHHPANLWDKNDSSKLDVEGGRKRKSITHPATTEKMKNNTGDGA